MVLPPDYRISYVEMSGMIKSLLGLSIRDTSSATSSSSASSTDGDCIDHQAASSSLSSNVDSSVKNDNLGKATEIPATAATTSVSEVNKEEDVTLDEEAIKEAVKDYGEQERLAPFRTKQILKKALKPNPPDEPDPSVSALSTNFSISIWCCKY